jgi:hypothetical protein
MDAVGAVIIEARIDRKRRNTTSVEPRLKRRKSDATEGRDDYDII